MYKKVSIFLIAICLLFGIAPIIPAKSAKAATPIIDGIISNVTITQNSDRTFTIKYTLLRNLESYETLVISGEWPGAYRNQLSGVGHTTYKTKATYTVYTNQAPSAPGWLSFSIKYTASGGTQAYTESKFVTSYFQGVQRTETFHTVTAVEAGAEWIALNLGVPIVLNLSLKNPLVKWAATGTYSVLMQLDGFADAVGSNAAVYHAKAGDYVRTVTYSESGGVLKTKTEVYQDKDAYNKNVTPTYESLRSYTLPR